MPMLAFLLFIAFPADTHPPRLAVAPATPWIEQERGRTGAPQLLNFDLLIEGGEVAADLGAGRGGGPRCR